MKNQLRPRHGQTAIYIVLLIAVCILMSVSKRCSSSGHLPAISQGNSSGDTIDVAIMYGPTSYYLYDDTLGGINFDLLLNFEKDTHTPIKFWPVVNLHDALERLENNTYDMIASLPADNSVKQRFLTSRSVFLDRLALIQLADSTGATEVTSALDLAGKTVHIQEDSPAAARIENLSHEIGDSIHIKTETDLSEEYLCMMVAIGKIPLAVVNEKTAIRMQRQYPRLSFDNPVSFTQFQVWILPKSDTILLNKTNSWLENFQSTESYRRIMDKY